MEYSPLNYPEYEIRLLKITPTSPRQPSKPINCTLEHGISMIGQPPNCPKYTALSYCWGDPAKTEKIVVNARTVYITKNLKAALTQISRNSKDKTLLWTDALCIDQANNQEKPEQIKLMSKIYRSAQRVVVWLGNPTSPMQTSLLYGCFEHPVRALWLDEPSSKALRASLQSLGDMPYWRRAWIIQELAVGQPVEIRYGDLRIPWVEFKNALAAAEISPYVPEDFESVLRVLNSFQARERINETGGRRVTLLEALFESRHSLSTRRRDKIYALRGLSSDGNDVLPDPNYVQPWETVCINATGNIIAGRGQVAAILLAGAKSASRADKLPTWVPDWSKMADEVIAPWVSKCIEHSAAVTRARATRIGRAREANDIPINVTGHHLYIPGEVYETVHAVFATTSKAAGASSGDTPAQHQVDFRTFSWHLYHAIHWTNSKFGSYMIAQQKKWTSHINALPMMVSETLQSLGFETLKDFAIFLRLLLDGYDVKEETAHLARLRNWMERNGSLTIHQGTVRGLLQEQLDAMQIFFLKNDTPTLTVTAPSEPQEFPINGTTSRSSAENDALTIRARLERLGVGRSPGPSRTPSEERRSSFQNDARLTWTNPNSPGSPGLTGLREDMLTALRSLLVNRRLPAESKIAAVADGLDRIDAGKMRLVATDARIRIVHQDTEVGDKIAVLPNCPLPVVLRPAFQTPSTVGSQYQYIGEAYSESFARLFREDWGEIKQAKSWPDIWKVDDVKIEKKKLITIGSWLLTTG